MINSNLTISEVFAEAKSRIDGTVTLIFMAIAGFSPVVIGFFRLLFQGGFVLRWYGFLAPLLIFIFYVRIRQWDFSEERSRQIFNAVLIIAVAVAWIYVLNFAKGDIYLGSSISFLYRSFENKNYHF